MVNLLHLLQRICDLLEAIYKSLKQASLAMYGHRGDREAISKRVDGNLLNINEVMDILAISRSTYYRFVREGRLSPRILGNRHYYYREDIEEQIQESKRRGRI